MSKKDGKPTKKQELTKAKASAKIETILKKVDPKWHETVVDMIAVDANAFKASTKIAKLLTSFDEGAREPILKAALASIGG